MGKQLAWVLLLTAGCLSCAGREQQEQNGGQRLTDKAANGTVAEGTTAGEQAPAGIETGHRAPEIILPDPGGKEIALSSLRGQVVLVDFWASWCGPCRKENPNIVAQYHQYKDKGFTIYSVSLDLKKEDWVRAIEKDGLAWPYHVSDLKFWYSEAAELYRIDAIPANFLLDGNGVILARNLYGPALGNYLKKLFRE